MNKPILCIDFDGVIHKYSKGWQNGVIYDDVVDWFFQWASNADSIFELYVYSSRSKTKEGISPMIKWFREQWHKHWMTEKSNADMVCNIDDERRNVLFFYRFDNVVFRLVLAHEKPPAFLTIDDRGVRFDGDWNAPYLKPEFLRAFKPWNAA